ncbi:hypothetical protein NDI52_34050 [Leptolyngbya sp. PL-A3]|uniref:hypothetical protein n=1 Tax=Leptolyngbya sp. PL-A3 TaxID=2933911 RepID=UPI003298F313
MGIQGKRSPSSPNANSSELLPKATASGSNLLDGGLLPDLSSMLVVVTGTLQSYSKLSIGVN